MCTTWLIEGRNCETGDDLIAALGEADARRVNSVYDIPGITEDAARANCLCLVDAECLASITRTEWRYDADRDIMVAAATRSGENND